MEKAVPKKGHTPVKARIKRLEAENELLREQLKVNDKRTLDAWLLIPPELRDRYAARAFINESGDVPSALNVLRFDLGEDYRAERSSKKVKELAQIVFGTPGCQKL